MDLFTLISELKEPDFVAPLEVWEDFMKGHIWKDMRRELCCWLTDTWELLEDTQDPVVAAELRGRARAIREVLDMPDNVCRMIITQHEEGM